MRNGNQSVSAFRIRVIALSTLAMGGLLLAHSARLVSGNTPGKVTIAYSTSSDAALAVVAQIQGYYDQEGLEAVPLRHSFGKAALNDVLTGKADFATVAETPVMYAIMKGEKISILATIQTSNKGYAIVARKDRGVAAPGDLRGRKIGVALGTTADFFMDAFLALHGVSRKDMTLIDLKPEELTDALAKGEVDAVAAFQPYLQQAERKLAEHGIVFYDEDIYTWTFNIVAKQDFISSNPEKVTKLLRALVKAEKFAETNPGKARRIVADFSRLDPVLVGEMWTYTRFRVSLDQSLVLALEDESRWAIRSGLTDAASVPNYLDFIYSKGLESVKPRAVRILK